jgi:uncharacterized protein YfaP (DUF2135 family)
VLLLFFSTVTAVHAKPPLVRITAPKGGWSTERIVEISGSVDDPEIEAVTLVVNGVPFAIQTQDGRFTQKLVMSTGENSIQAMAVNADGQEGRDSISIFSQVPKVDIRAFLTWQVQGQIIDLWVVEPGEEICKWNHMQTSAGGTLYDLYGGAIGYGPQTYTMAAAVPGNYRFQVKYWSDQGMPQTEVRIDLVLYEGTDHEERRTFYTVLTKTGDVYGIGNVEIQPQGGVKFTAVSGRVTNAGED